MNVIVKREPFPHVIIENFYDQVEYDKVWKELLFLYPKMFPPSLTGSAKTEFGVPRKKGIGVFIGQVYNNFAFSDIAISSNKIFSDSFKVKIENDTDFDKMFYFKLYKTMTNSDALIQLYMNGDYYTAHQDHSTFTHVTVVHKTPKNYTGGEFYFPEFDYVVNLEDNTSILFPSILLHEVLEVKSLSKDPEDGRFSISQLIVSQIPSNKKE